MQQYNANTRLPKTSKETNKIYLIIILPKMHYNLSSLLVVPCFMFLLDSSRAVYINTTKCRLLFCTT